MKIYMMLLLVVLVGIAPLILAQQQPTIVPLSYTAFLDPSDVSVRFTCTGEGSVLWRVDGQGASNTEIWDRGISTEEDKGDDNFTSQIIIPATLENNNTEVQCLAVGDDVFTSSEVVTFIVQGPLALPPNLTIVENDACSIKLVWSAPFTLDVSGVDPDISTYTICSNITGYCGSTSGSGVLEYVIPRPFRYVEFRVSAVNGAGQGNENLVLYKPDTVSTNVSFENATSPSVSLSFMANCSMNYSIVIVDENSTASVHNHTSMPDENGTVTVIIDSGLENDENYNFTVTENVTEGMKGNPSGSFNTFDVQDKDYTPGPGEISVTCYFAVGSHALGCYVVISTSTMLVQDGDIRRENITDSSSMMWHLSDSATRVFSGLEVGTYSVVLYDIEYDDKFDLTKGIHLETVNVTETAPTRITDVPTDETTDELTDEPTDEPTDVATSITTASTFESSASTPIPDGPGVDSPTVGIVVGVVVAAIVVAAIFIVAVILLILMVRWCYKKIKSGFFSPQNNGHNGIELNETNAGTDNDTDHGGIDDRDSGMDDEDDLNKSIDEHPNDASDMSQPTTVTDHNSSAGVEQNTNAGLKQQQAPPHSCEVSNSDEVKQLTAGNRELDERTLDYKNTEDKLTPLHVAALHGHLEIVEVLLEQPQAKVNIRDKKKCTPLHFASKEGHLDVLKALVSKGASLEMEDYPNKWTPLHHASANGHTQVVRCLIQAGCCVDHQDIEKCTPLFGGCKEGHLEVVKCLVVEGKANVHHRDKDKHTPLHTASARGHIGVVVFLVNEARADVFSRDNKSRTPWEYATLSVHVEVTNFLHETMEKKHYESPLSNTPVGVPPPKDTLNIPLKNTAPVLPPKGEFDTPLPFRPPTKGDRQTSVVSVSTIDLDVSPPPPTAVTTPDSVDQHMETMSLPGSVQDDLCDIDALNISVTSRSTPATRSASRSSMSGVSQASMTRNSSFATRLSKSEGLHSLAEETEV